MQSVVLLERFSSVQAVLASCSDAPRGKNKKKKSQNYTNAVPFALQLHLYVF